MNKVQKIHFDGDAVAGVTLYDGTKLTGKDATRLLSPDYRPEPETPPREEEKPKMQKSKAAEAKARLEGDQEG